MWRSGKLPAASSGSAPLPALPVPPVSAAPSRGARRPAAACCPGGGRQGAGKGAAGSAGAARVEPAVSPAGRRTRLPGGPTSCGLWLRALLPGAAGAAGAPRLEPESFKSRCVRRTTGRARAAAAACVAKRRPREARDAFPAGRPRWLRTPNRSRVGERPGRGRPRRGPGPAAAGGELR